jgi:hypothetical protein
MSIHEDELIVEKTRKFTILERDFLKCWYGTGRPSTKEELLDLFKEAVHIAEKAFLTKQEILHYFLKTSEIIVSDAEVQKTLEKIKRDEAFYSIAFYADVAKVLKEDATAKAAPAYDDDVISNLIDRKWDELFEDFHSWFSISDYYSAQMTIGPVISSFEVPSHLMVYFNEIRETFAFGQYRAATALCRALLEKCLYEKLNDVGAFSSETEGTVTPFPGNALSDVSKQTVIPMINPGEEKLPGLSTYIRKAKTHNLLSKSDANTAYRINRDANDILHVRETPPTPTETKTLDIIRDTLSILQSLYR